MNFFEPCTQQAFGDLVGISQPAVSDHMASGEMIPGETAGEWLRDYCEHLREQAAGRGADGELAHQRAELTRVNRERAEIKLAQERKEFAPVALQELLIKHVGSQISDHLRALVGQLKTRCPRMSADDLKIAEDIVAETLNVVEGMGLASLSAMDDEDDEGAA